MKFLSMKEWVEYCISRGAPLTKENIEKWRSALYLFNLGVAYALGYLPNWNDLGLDNPEKNV